MVVGLMTWLVSLRPFINPASIASACSQASVICVIEEKLMLRTVLISRPDSVANSSVKGKWRCERRNTTVNGLRTILLVEHRDEVFARLARDCAAMNIQVERARNTVEVFHCFNCYPPDLMLANADLPYEGGWLLAAKSRLILPRVQIWLYAAKPSWSREYDRGLAGFLGVAELVYYEGDLLLLAQEVQRRFLRSARRSSFLFGHNRGTHHV